MENYMVYVYFCKFGERKQVGWHPIAQKLQKGDIITNSFEPAFPHSDFTDKTTTESFGNTISKLEIEEYLSLKNHYIYSS